LIVRVIEKFGKLGIDLRIRFRRIIAVLGAIAGGGLRFLLTIRGNSRCGTCLCCGLFPIGNGTSDFHRPFVRYDQSKECGNRKTQGRKILRQVHNIRPRLNERRRISRTGCSQHERRVDQGQEKSGTMWWRAIVSKSVKQDVGSGEKPARDQQRTDVQRIY